LPGWAELPAGEGAGRDAGVAEEDEDGAADRAEPVGKGEPTARGVGSLGCGAHERMRVGAGVGPGAGLIRGLGLGAEDADADGPETGVNGSGSLKRAEGRSKPNSAGPRSADRSAMG